MDAMNIYEDYQSYITEFGDLIKKMEESNSVLMNYIGDVKRATDYLYQKYKKNGKLELDEEDIFDLGFGFLSNVFQDINTYYEDYFGKNMEIFNYYTPLMVDAIYIEDFKSHLENEEVLTDERKEVIEDALAQIDEIMSKKRPFSKTLSDELVAKVEQICPDKDKFRPVCAVFQMICEEFRLF